MSITCTVIAAVALAAMWVRSHRVADSIGYGQRFTASDGGYRTGVGSVRSSRGGVYFGAGYFLPIFLASGPAREGVFHEHDASPAEVRPPPAWSLLGFSFRRIDAGDALVIRTFGVPYWFLNACAAGTLVVSWRRRRRARRASGTCATCGYDLRESRERCPECGTPIPADGGADKLREQAKGGVRQS